MDEKRKLRAEMRALRRTHEAALPNETRALLFKRPPSPIAGLAAENAVVGLYYAIPPEAPTLSYARWFHENGRRVALPWFEDRGAPMRFRIWSNPWDETLLETGPFDLIQPRADAEEAEPALMIVPLLAFTAEGDRLGQGGGYYDRWHAAHPLVPAIGIAWDCQLVDSLPTESHDHPLDAVVTPTRLYEGR